MRLKAESPAFMLFC